MADFPRRRWTTSKIAVPRRGRVDEEINPSSGWTNDFPGFHCLLVDLPGFEKDDIKLNFDEPGIIEVSGRRKVDDEKQEHFKKTFNVPEDGDVENGEMIFEGGTLRVRIPKAAKNGTSKPSSADGASTKNINTDKKKRYRYQQFCCSSKQESCF
ncbi:18.1 kDa class I heat shock protein-like [Chenopodium quinoa]|uniref:18.1 kDa class I heat shock protein-like n=1 Tax=Chenopodium quinoa TaxID=63459 RepID=UPI000B77D5ED|nr:18.1 kDa class I heat shock protein-like [Chenopodium quinoa]